MPSRPRLQLVPSPGAPLTERSDEQLMLLVQAGMREAFAALVERHALRLASACSRLVFDPHVGTELAQETWLSVWDRRASYRDEGRFLVWLYTLARNRCRNHLRHRGVVRRYAEELALPAPPTTTGADLDHLIARERERHVRRALSRLPEPMRQVLVLRFAEELRYDEIGAVLGVPEATLRSRVFHALKRLRRLLQEEP